MERERMKTLEYKTTTGKVLRLRAVHPALINRIGAGIAWPERPHYDREIAGGEVEHIYHDESSLQTPTEHKAWEEYQEKLEAAEAEYFRRKVRLYVRQGVEVETPDGREAAEYIEESLATMTDVLAVLSGIDRLSLVDTEALVEAGKMFRDQLEGRTT
jgi:hypothetical protein